MKVDHHDKRGEMSYRLTTKSDLVTKAFFVETPINLYFTIFWEQLTTSEGLFLLRSIQKDALQHVVLRFPLPWNYPLQNCLLVHIFIRKTINNSSHASTWQMLGPARNLFPKGTWTCCMEPPWRGCIEAGVSILEIQPSPSCTATFLARTLLASLLKTHPQPHSVADQEIPANVGI